MKKLAVFALFAAVGPCAYAVVAADTTASRPASAPATAPATQAAVDPAKAADIRKLLEIQGSGKAGEQLKSQILAGLKQRMPQVSEKAWIDAARDINPAELLDLFVAVYDQNYTHEDVKALLEFYSTPLAKKIRDTQQAVSNGCMRATLQWSKQQSEKLVKKISATQSPIE